MNVEYFFDTNVLVYSFDRLVPEKQKCAAGLIENSLQSGLGVISWQVVQEFINVALHKWDKPMSLDQAVTYLNDILMPMCRIFPSNDIWSSALHIQLNYRYRFYDSLIIASAIKSGAKILFSEDLQHGQLIGELEIRNPFIEISK